MSLVNYTALRWDKSGTIFISSFTCFCLVLCLIFPFVTSAFFYCNFHKTKSEDFVNTYGAIYEGLRLNEVQDKSDSPPTKKNVIVHQFYFLFRRLMLGILVV